MNDIIIRLNGITFSGAQAKQINRTKRALREQGRRGIVHPDGSVTVVDGQPLPSAEEILQLLQAASPGSTRGSRVITARQIRLWLVSAGILPQIEPMLEALPEPQRSRALIEWEYATEFQRTHPLVIQIGEALGMTEADLDLAWEHAASL